MFAFYTKCFSFAFLCLRCKDSVITIVPGTDLFESDYFHKNHNMYAMRAQLFFQTEIFIWNTFTLCITRQTQLKMKFNLDFTLPNSFLKIQSLNFVSFQSFQNSDEFLIILQLHPNIIFITVSDLTSADPVYNSGSFKIKNESSIS